MKAMVSLLHVGLVGSMITSASSFVLSRHKPTAATRQNMKSLAAMTTSRKRLISSSSSLHGGPKKATLAATFNMASNDEAGQDNNKLAVPNKRARLHHRFSPSEPVLPFKWAPPQVIHANNFGCDELLTDNAFFDKSAPLYNLLKEHYNHDTGDFRSVPLRLVYTRRFGKSVLLDFIRSTFSPFLNTQYNPDVIRAKIASLERGRELLNFGLHPVVCLNMLCVMDVHSLHCEIKWGIEHAGLGKTINNDDDDTMSPAERLLHGVKQLNDKFEAQTGVPTKTIVLIDEYDHPFRKRRTPSNDPNLAAITELYCVGKQNDTGISLMVLFGLTRMVSTELNSFVDVSRLSVHHGLCGVSTSELVRCANGQLDQQAKEKYDGQTFEQILHNRFGPAWSGFRFGLDDVVGELDPTSPEGALFSPVDAWELVESLVEKHSYPPSSHWQSTTGYEFESTSIADKYVLSKEAFFGLCRNLYGGWVDITDPRWTMERDEYLLLDNDLQVKQFLLEVGFLTVKDVDKNMVRLGSPNRKVTSNALELLNRTCRRNMPALRLLNDIPKDDVPSKRLAFGYFSQAGFSTIVSDAAREVSVVFRRRETAKGASDVFSDFPYEDYLYMELLYRLPDDDDAILNNVEKSRLYREAPVTLQEEVRRDQLQTNTNHHVIGVGLWYDDYLEKDQSLAVIIELTIALITECDADSIYSAHQKNMEVAKERVLSYVWQGPKVAKEQRVVVSGVWCPTSKETDASMELQARFEFVTPKTAKRRK